MNVSAVIVTRGDVDLTPIYESLPDEWEKIVWDNGAGEVTLYNGPWARRYGPGITKEVWPASDLAVYGRYAAIEHASHDVIYVQDDDCVVSDPQAIVDAWAAASAYPFDGRKPGDTDPRDYVDYVVCNMPARFRHDFYTDHALVGFGAAFHRDAPARAFERLREVVPLLGGPDVWGPRFRNTCDIAFTGLTPRVLVDVEYEEREFACDDDRMWRQPGHVEERTRMRSLVSQVLGS